MPQKFALHSGAIKLGHLLKRSEPVEEGCHVPARAVSKREIRLGEESDD